MQYARTFGDGKGIAQDMAYNRRNKLLQMQRVIEVYKDRKLPGVSTAYVYRTYIWPEFHISMATLYNYLGTPVTRELKEMSMKQQELF